MLFCLLIASIAVVTIVGNGNFAQLADSEITVSNTFTADALDLQVRNLNPGIWVNESGAPVQLWFGFSDSETINDLLTSGEDTIYIDIRNNGSIAGIVRLNFVNIVDYENGCNELEILMDTSCGDPGVGEGELSQYLHLVVLYDGQEKANDTLSNLTDPGSIIELGALDAGAHEEVVLEISTDYVGAGAIILGDTSYFGISCELVQVQP